MLRNEYKLTVSNESLRVATTEQQNGKHKFLNAILSLTLAVNKHDSSTRTMPEEETSRESQKPLVFPHLLTNVTIDKSLFHDLQIKDRRDS